MRWLDTELNSLVSMRSVPVRRPILYDDTPHPVTYHYGSHMRTAIQTVGMVWDYCRDKTIQAKLKRENAGPKRNQAYLPSAAGGSIIRKCIRCKRNFASERVLALCPSCRQLKKPPTNP